MTLRALALTAAIPPLCAACLHVHVHEERAVPAARVESRPATSAQSADAGPAAAPGLRDRAVARAAEPEPPASFDLRPPRERGGLIGARSSGALADRRAAAAVVAGLDWLARNQRDDGSWDSGARASGFDVGVTGLALLAFLGAGETTERGRHASAVRAAVDWLVAQQDPDLGLIGERLGHAYMYNHAIAAAALCELIALEARGADDPLRATAQSALAFAARARNPYSAWRYDYPPTGESDMSVTSWMVLALLAAEDAGLRIDVQAFDGALNFQQEVTDASSARIGYDSVGSLSARVVGINDGYPPESGEAMTAAGLLTRLLMARAEDSPMTQRQLQLLLRRQPEWDPSGVTNDFYYWFFASHALRNAGDAAAWSKWNRSLVRELARNQESEGAERGSWPPASAWSYAGGRPYATALLTLALESGGALQ